MIGKVDDFLKFQETALSLRGQRQQLLASNIANADTPNYKARDIDFKSALDGALGKTLEAASGGPAARPSQLARTAAAHLSGIADTEHTAGGVPLLYRPVRQGSADNNTVDLDAERNQFADNSIRYEASLTIISTQIKSMLSAIQG